MSIQIVTIKTRSIQDPAGCIEYQILSDADEVVSHGHQVALPESTGAATTLAEAQAIVENDAYRRGIVAAPEGWVDPSPPVVEASPEEPAQE